MGIRLVTASTDPDIPTMDFGRRGSIRAPAYSARGDFWFQPLFEHSFEATIEHVSGQGGVLAPPNAPQWMTFGIVLNIAYEHVLVDYGDGGLFQTSGAFRRPVLDCATRDSIPWVMEPSTQTLVIPIVDPDSGDVLNIITEEIAINPSYERIYGRAGLGELLNPFDASGYSRSPDHRQRLTLRFKDRPRLSVRRMKNQSRLQRMEQVLWFRFWIVAMPGRRVLATSPFYTLGGWFETHSTSMRSMEPRPTHFSYGLPGQHRRLFRNNDELNRARTAYRGNINVRPGRVGALPVVTGQTANERIATWLQSEGLGPTLPTARTPNVAVANAHR